MTQTTPIKSIRQVRCSEVRDKSRCLASSFERLPCRECIKTRSFAIAKRTARRSCLVDLVHCAALFYATYGLDIPDFSNGVYPVSIKAVLVILALFDRERRIGVSR